MHKTLLTFKRNYSEILNDITSTYPSSCLERVNHKIKHIERKDIKKARKINRNYVPWHHLFLA